MIIPIIATFILLSVILGIVFSKREKEVLLILSVLFGVLGLFLLIIVPFVYSYNLKRLEFIEVTYPSIVLNEVASTPDMSVLDKEKLNSYTFPVAYLEDTERSNDTSYAASNTQIIDMYNNYLQVLRTSRTSDLVWGILVPEVPTYLKPVVLISK